MSIGIRAARHGDEAAIVALLRGLAEYEKLLDRFRIDEAIVARDYLSDNPPIHCELACDGERPVGLASWYWIYASFAAKRVIYLEDFFVVAEMRGRGFGKALMRELARKAVEAGAEAVEWRVLDWNKPSIEFYESLGARHSGDWLTYYLAGDSLNDMAKP